MKKIMILITAGLLGGSIANAQVKADKKVLITAPVQKTPVKKKEPIVVVMKPATVAKPLKITSHADGQDAYGTIQILGTGEPGLNITVSLYAFAEVTPKKGKSLWETFKAVTIPTSTYSAVKDAITKKVGPQVKEKHFKTYQVVIDKNGKWYIPVFPAFGTTNWMANAYIPFAWVVSAFSTDPNYREGNTTSIRLGCKIN